MNESPPRTPGPWTQQDETRLRWPPEVAIPICGQSEVVAFVNPNLGRGPANATLIAAAPDLLEALRALLAWGRDHTGPTMENSPHSLLVAAHHAIVKAEGKEINR